MKWSNRSQLLDTLELIIIKYIKLQINKASVISSCLRDVIWNNKHIMSIDSIESSNIQNMHTTHLWHQDSSRHKKIKNMLRTAEIKTLRSIAAKTLRDRVKSATVGETCRLEGIIRWGRKRKRY